jgi:hypothetical protein
MMDWKPMGSEPKDGSRFLIYAPAQMGFKPLYGVAAWHTLTWSGPFLSHDWAENIACSNCSIEVDDPEPTHWVALPEPPTKPSRKEYLKLKARERRARQKAAGAADSGDGK